MTRLALGMMLALAAASCRPRDSRNEPAAPPGRGDASSVADSHFGKEISAVDDLATDNIRDITRKYRPLGLEVVDVMASAIKSDPRPRVRANAVSILFDACYFAGHADTALPYLLQALGDPDADVETRAADVLAGWFLDHSDVSSRSKVDFWATIKPVIMTPNVTMVASTADSDSTPTSRTIVSSTANTKIASAMEIRNCGVHMPVLIPRISHTDTTRYSMLNAITNRFPK